MTATTTAPADFQVSDLGLAPFGRNEIRLAEHGCPASWPCGVSTPTASR